MKKLVYTAALLMIMISASAQQFPFLEGYNLNQFGLSSSYAGIYNQKTLFMEYRSDWSGMMGGPSTMRMSYNDKFSEKIGLGGKFIYDKTDIFKQTLLMCSYTYEVKAFENHLLNFGISGGFFRNSIDLAKYYNNPDYVQDDVLIYGREKSKIKFATDISALYRYDQLETGFLFSNVMFGTAKYRNSDLTYKPFKNLLVHASYNFVLDEKWSIKPIIIFRDGKNVPGQFEISPSVTWDNRLWGNVLFRSGGIFGLGFGGEVYKGILLNYSYNLSSGISLNTFGSHQITLGVRVQDVLNIVKQ